MLRLTLCSVVPLLFAVAWGRTLENRSENVTETIIPAQLSGEREDLVVRIARPDYCDVIELVDAPSCGGEKQSYRYDSLSKSCVQYLRDNCSTSLNTFNTYDGCMNVCSRPEPVVDQDDPEEKMSCNCDWSYFRHYQAKNCTPVYSEEQDHCQCPIRFDCPTNLSRNQECTLNGKTYKIGSPVETNNPCAICTCTADLISCQTVECPSPKNPQTSSNCYHVFDPAPNDCCMKVACYNSTNEDELQKIHRCNYKDRSYMLGERIFPDEDPCLTCICTANWTGVNNSSCRRHDCMIENDIHELQRGCIPIYQENACCPNGYHCPNEDSLNEDGLPKLCLLPPETGLCDAAFPRYFYNSSSGQCSEFTYGGCGGNQNNLETFEECEISCGSQRNQPVPENFKENRCYFDHRYYHLGASLDAKHDSDCVTCTCSVPPDFTCIHRSCPAPPNNDYDNCVFKYKPNACCPEYECSKVSSSTPCPQVDCSEPGCVFKEEPDTCGRCDCVSVCPPVVCAPGCILEQEAPEGRCPECICNASRQSRETECPTPQCAEESCKIVDGPEGCPTCLCPSNHECPVTTCEPGCEMVKDYPAQQCPVCRCDSRNDIAEEELSCTTPKCDKYCHLTKGGDGCSQCICEPLCLPPDCACSEPQCELLGCEIEKEAPYGRCLGCVCPEKSTEEDRKEKF